MDFNKRKACLAIILALTITKRNLRRRKWVKKWFKKRQVFTHLNLLDEIQITDAEDYRNYFCMSDSNFDKLL